jgi:hypothetical protein
MCLVGELTSVLNSPFSIVVLHNQNVVTALAILNESWMCLLKRISVMASLSNLAMY